MNENYIARFESIHAKVKHLKGPARREEGLIQMIIDIEDHWAKDQKKISELSENIGDLRRQAHNQIQNAKIQNAEEPASREQKLIQMIIDLDIHWAIDRFLTNRFDISHFKAQNYVMPLTVREYGTMIEEAHPEIMGNNQLEVPLEFYYKFFDPNDRGDIDTKRIYSWNKMILTGSRTNQYLRCVIGGIDEHYKKVCKVENIDKSSDSYKFYVLSFSKSVVNAIEFGNMILKYGQSEGVQLRPLLRFYDNFVDLNMAIFYNSFITTRFIREDVMNKIEVALNALDLKCNTTAPRNR